jgi:glycosyltransferase involved in cell wall biosynthesis
MDAARIVAFTKDWSDVPTCTTHVLRGMSAERWVLWINSIGMRRPSLARSSDIKRLRRRVVDGFGRAKHVGGLLRVLSPLAVPGARSGPGRWLNRLILRNLIARELADMGRGPVEYWCFLPNAVDLLPGRSKAEGRASKVVYYCVDDWSEFTQYDTAWLAQKERQMLARADVVFTPSRYLQEKCEKTLRALRESGGERQSADYRLQTADHRLQTAVYYTPHGVEYAKFAAATGDAVSVPQDMAGLPRPVVGFYGNLYPWIDFGLIEGLARARPQMSFVLIGQVYCDVSALQRCANVHVLGRREHAVLPAYCKAFDAAMIPYRIDDPRMQSVNPVKAKELLAAGVPVVSADIPEMRGYGGDVLLCHAQDEWLAALDRQVARKDRAAISERVTCEDWAEKVRQLRQIVDALP